LVNAAISKLIVYQTTLHKPISVIDRSFVINVASK